MPHERAKRIADGLWFIPVALGGVTAAVLVGWAGVAIIESPAAPAAVLLPLGSWLSYLSVGLVLAAVVWRAGGRLEIAGLPDAATWLAAGLVPLVAASINRLDRGGQWLAYHALEAGWLAIGAVACGLVCWSRRTGSSRVAQMRRTISRPQYSPALSWHSWPFDGNQRDPGQPWWSLGGTLAALRHCHGPWPGPPQPAVCVCLDGLGRAGGVLALVSAVDGAVDPIRFRSSANRLSSAGWRRLSWSW